MMSKNFIILCQYYVCRCKCETWKSSKDPGIFKDSTFIRVAAVGQELVCKRELIMLVSGRPSHRDFTIGQNKSIVREYKETKEPWDLEGHSYFGLK